MKALIFSICITYIAFAALNPQEFKIEVRYGFNEWKTVGSLRIPKSSYESPFVLFSDDTKYLIDQSLFKENNAQSANIRLSEMKNSSKYWITHIDQQQLNSLGDRYQETIQLVISNQNDLSSFDFSLEPLKKINPQDQEVQVRYFISQIAPDQIQVEQEKPQEETQDEKKGGIFHYIMSYKWWIIGFFVIFFVAGNLDPQKLNEQLSEQQQSTPGQARRQPRRQ